LIKINTLAGGDNPEPIRGRLSRLKAEVKNEDAAALMDFEHDMRSALENLERSYRTKESL
jgi:V/A-type H+-transporting ATPase subunit A